MNFRFSCFVFVKCIDQLSKTLILGFNENEIILNYEILRETITKTNFLEIIRSFPVKFFLFIWLHFCCLGE